MTDELLTFMLIPQVLPEEGTTDQVRGSMVYFRLAPDAGEGEVRSVLRELGQNLVDQPDDFDPFVLGICRYLADPTYERWGEDFPVTP